MESMSTENKESPKKFENKQLGFYAHSPTVKTEAQKLELKQQRKASMLFFRIGKPIKKPETKQLAKEISEAKHPVSLDNHSARAIVIAISKVMNEKAKFPHIKFTLGNTIFNCVANPTTLQIGNVEVRIDQFNTNGSYFVPPYEDKVATNSATGRNFTIPGLMAYLNAIIGNGANKVAREKRLASLFIEKGKQMQSFRLADFNSNGFIRLESEAPCTFNLNKDIAFNDVEKGYTIQSKRLSQFIHILNFINFMHVIVEVSRRLYRDDHGDIQNYPTSNAKKIDKFPVASFHVRVLKLIIAGKVRFNQLFTNGKPYGVVTGIGTATNFATILQKALDINSLMSDHHHEIFQFKTERKYKHHYLQSRAPLIRKEFGEEFGGSSESSGNEATYESLDADIAFSMASEEEEDLGLNAFDNLSLGDIMKTFEAPKQEKKEKNSTQAKKTSTSSSSTSSYAYSGNSAQLSKQRIFHQKHSPASGIHDQESDQENNSEDDSTSGNSPSASSS